MTIFDYMTTIVSPI